MAPVITLTTDFGVGDGYAAGMKGVILSVNPQAVIVDICHTIKPQDIKQAAFIISTVHSSFPKDTIHVVVIDPCVGGDRRGVAVRTPDGCYIAPDNGLLSHVITEYLSEIRTSKRTEIRTVKLPNTIKAVSLTNREYWRSEVSPTFHGRDIFAPVAAHLSLGIPLEAVGDSIDSLNLFTIPKPHRNKRGVIAGCALHIDTFGNIITNIRKKDIPETAIIVEIAGKKIRGLSEYYAQRKSLCTLIGSSGYLEIALPNGSAASTFGVKVGDGVRVTTYIGVTNNLERRV
ncbi:MAG TPA: S-adenosyl-l-methionine hydroxide adenosyltransferase [Dehalococcoidia bacterium]|nr:S-adenosyl-l-methionine hydroxide adenosyltransferase [Dehalococcoidia bacterium]